MKHPLVARATVPSPYGPLTMSATARGLAVAWFDTETRDPARTDAPEDPQHPVLRQAAADFAAYWQDPHHRFTVPLDPQGTPFQHAVWDALLEIGCGELKSYGEVARRIGKPQAVRAVGAAIGRNPVAIIVPCHRVIGKDGTLTGYAGGLDRKQALLAHEGRQVRA